MGGPCRARPRRDLAGERIGPPLLQPARPARRAARPELHRYRPLPHRRRRGLRVLHHQARPPIPWRNHRSAWRPPHIHFSLFGTDFTQRLVTQMYFPGYPLIAFDPIYRSIVDPRARRRLVATYDHDVTEHEWCTGYRWDIVLTGSPPHRWRRRSMTPADSRPDGRSVLRLRPRVRRRLRAGARRLTRRVRLHGRVLDGAGEPVPDALLELWQADPSACWCGGPDPCAATATPSPAGAAPPPTGPPPTPSPRSRPAPPAGRDPARGPAVLRSHRLRARVPRRAVHAGLPAVGRPGIRSCRRSPQRAGTPSSPWPTATASRSTSASRARARPFFLAHPTRHSDVAERHVLARRRPGG